MKSGKRILWGILFILCAVLIVVASVGGFNGLEGFGIRAILMGILLLAMLYLGITHRSVTMILLSVGWLLHLLNSHYQWFPMGFWRITGVAVLLSIGINLLRPKHNRVWIGHSNMTEESGKGINVGDVGHAGDAALPENNTEGNDVVHCEAVFTETSRYVTSSSLQEVRLEGVFAKINVFLDNASLCGGQGKVSSELVFGTANIYIPASWSLDLDQENVFSHVNVHGRFATNSEQRLRIKAENVFSSLHIYAVEEGK